MNGIVDAINNLAEPRVIDWVTLAVASASFIVSGIAVYVTYQQKAISKRAERAKILDDLFDMLHILKKYDGDNIDIEVLDGVFKKLQKMKITNVDILSEPAIEFISEILEKMHRIGTLKSLKENGLPDLTLEILKKNGVNLDVEELKTKNFEEYSEHRLFFYKDAFTRYQELFITPKTKKGK